MNKVKKTIKDFIEFSIFTIITITVSTTLAANLKPNMEEYSNGSLLTAQMLSNTKLDWNQIEGKQTTFEPSGHFCVFHMKERSCPNWAPYAKGNGAEMHTISEMIATKTGGSGHGYGVDVCCTYEHTP